MTKEDVARLIGELMQNRQEARQQRGCLRIKARNAAYALRKVANNLFAAADGKTFEDFDGGGFPTADEIEALVIEMRETLRGISQMNDDLRGAGIDAPRGPE